ncbi:hypothetical protein PybrP1_000117, partial [[Pythium] brassicae (nom. inval.)]
PLPHAWTESRALLLRWLRLSTTSAMPQSSAAQSSQSTAKSSTWRSPERSFQHSGLSAASPCASSTVPHRGAHASLSQPRTTGDGTSPSTWMISVSLVTAPRLSSRSTRMPPSGVPTVPVSTMMPPKTSETCVSVSNSPSPMKITGLNTLSAASENVYAAWPSTTSANVGLLKIVHYSATN